MLEPTDFLRLALDPVRLAVLGASAYRPVDPSRLAVDLDVPEKQVLGAVGSLRAAGLLGDDLRLDREVLRLVAQRLPDFEQPHPRSLEGSWSPVERDILSRFFRGSRLEAIPTNQSKRRVILERLAQEFEPGIRYPERDVNLALQSFHPDYAALRRYLVDEALLTRADGVYWRSGGRTGI